MADSWDNRVAIVITNIYIYIMINPVQGRLWLIFFAAAGEGTMVTVCLLNFITAIIKTIFFPSEVQNARYYRVKGKPRAVFLFP